MVGSIGLLPAEPELRLVHEVGAQDGYVLLELGKYGLADTQGLNGCFVGSGQKVFVVRGGHAEYVT